MEHQTPLHVDLRLRFSKFRGTTRKHAESRIFAADPPHRTRNSVCFRGQSKRSDEAFRKLRGFRAESRLGTAEQRGSTRNLGSSRRVPAHQTRNSAPSACFRGQSKRSREAFPQAPRVLRPVPPWTGQIWPISDPL